MSTREFSLVVVRHGEGTHNLPEGDPGRSLNYTGDGDLDTELTALGREQAALVAASLRDTDFHLAVSSDLVRARDTALAVLGARGLELEQWPLVRERKFGGVLEGELALIKAQCRVEAAVVDRELLTWRPPQGGESVADMAARVRLFLQEVSARTMALPQPCPRVLVASHALWMAELYRQLAGPGWGEKPLLRNTGIDSYRLAVRQGEEGLVREGVECLMVSCASHLD